MRYESQFENNRYSLDLPDGKEEDDKEDQQEEKADEKADQRDQQEQTEEKADEKAEEKVEERAEEKAESKEKSEDKENQKKEGRYQKAEQKFERFKADPRLNNFVLVREESKMRRQLSFCIAKLIGKEEVVIGGLGTNISRMILMQEILQQRLDGLTYEVHFFSMR